MKLLRTLLRLPSSGFDEKLMTGDANIDAFIRSLDAELVGSKMVRSLTLEEARDHLLSYKQKLIDDGATDEAASQNAIECFGSVVEYGAEQRQERRSTFFKMMLSMGLSFAILMSLFNLLNASELALPWFFHLAMFAFYFVLFGGSMGFLLTFCFAPAKPTQSSSALAQGEVLEVFSPQRSKAIAAALGLVMLVLSACCALGLFGIGFMAYNHPAVNLMLVYIAMGMVKASPVAFSRYLLDSQSLTMETPFAASRQLLLGDLVMVQPVTGWRRWLRIDLGQAYELRFRSRQGKESSTRLVLNGEMHNSDQLLAFLNNKVAQQI